MTSIHLQAARTRVTIRPDLGGRIAQFEAFHGDTWVPLLHEGNEQVPADARDPMSWGPFVMAPWPNRIALGRFRWGGESFSIPANLGGHAAHGVAFDAQWRVGAASQTACELSLDFDDRWPFGGNVTQRIEALDDGLMQAVEIYATDKPFPAGAGWHPWFRRDVAGSEQVNVLVDADETYELVDKIPTGAMLPVVQERDLRGYPPVGSRRLDDCYRGPRGAMRVRWGDLELWLQSSENVTHAVVYTPEHAICVEPQTCAIDAFNLEARGLVDTGVQVVEPGAPLVATTVWRWASVGPLA
jgi:aldose 1-epimerase